MKIAGNANLAAPPERVWDAFHDPESLARCLPGCNTLTEIGPHQYAMSITAGVAAIKGTYDGQVHQTAQEHPEAFTLKAKGAGAPGTVDADVKVRLSPDGNGGTNLTYEADAAVGGAIGGVGQRMLAGVSKKMAGQFFTAVDQDIAGVRKAVPSLPGAPAVPAIGAAPSVTAPGAPAVYAGSPAGVPLGADQRFVLGVGLGALVALAGVLVGAVLGRRG
jgi:carbon monoxide dehydrogenase subunit G